MRMRTVVVMLVILTIFIVSVGVSRGWFAFSSQRSSGGETVGVSVTVDSKKATADAHAVEAEARSLTGTTATAAPQAKPAN